MARKVLKTVVTQILNFFQTSRRTFYWASFIALILTFPVFYGWHEVYTEHNLPVQIQLSAPEADYIRVYWDNPKFDPTAYDRISVGSAESKNRKDERFSIYTMNVVDTPWHRLKFIAENGSKLRIRELKARDQIIESQDREGFVLPFQFWNRSSCTVVSSLISFFWMMMLFMSTIHLWQRQPGKRFGFWTYSVGLAIALAGFWLLVFYPGLMTVDSTTEWINALKLLRESAQPESWYPPITTLLMKASYVISQEYGLFTFLQLLLFYLSIVLLIFCICGCRFALIATSIILINPAIWNQGAAVTKDVWTVSTLNLLLWSILLFQSSATRFTQKIALIIVFIISCTSFLLFRYNSIVALPAIVASICICVRSVKWKIAFIAGCLVALSVSRLPPETYGFKKVPTAAASIAWEHVGVLKQIGNPEAIEKYNLNFIGDTRSAIERYHCLAHDNLFWHSAHPFSLKKTLVQSQKVQKSFQALVVSHPKEFVLNRLCIYKSLLGFDNVVPLYIADKTLYLDVGQAYSIVYHPKLKELGDKIIEATRNIFTQPFPFFTPWTTLLGMILIFCLLKYLRMPTKIFVVFFGIALSYFASFFILTPGFHFRYFLPSYVLLFMLFFHSSERIMSRFFQKTQLS